MVHTYVGAGMAVLVVGAGVYLLLRARRRRERAQISRASTVLTDRKPNAA